MRRVGEWESGRVGDTETRRVEAGPQDSYSLSPPLRVSQLLVSSLLVSQLPLFSKCAECADWFKVDD